MEKNMVLLCEIWKYSANEYMEFLTRYNIDCFSVGTLLKQTVAIFVNQDKYLQVSVNDENFSKNEKQLVHLLELVEELIENAAKLEMNNEPIDEIPYQNEDED